MCAVFSLPMAPFSGIVLYCVRLFLNARHALNLLHFDNFIHVRVCVCMCLYSPKLAPLLYWDPSGQTMAQQGAFTPICHRLSPFVCPDKQNVGPRSPPVRPQSHVGSAALLFSCFYVPFSFLVNSSALHASWGKHVLKIVSPV